MTFRFASQPGSAFGSIAYVRPPAITNATTADEPMRGFLQNICWQLLEVMTKKRQRAGGRRGEIVFDPEARKSYLRGFSERKKDRRVYGLAMQKVKDRKAKIEQRAEEKQAVQEQIEQAERQKEELLEEMIEEDKKSIVRAPFGDDDSDRGIKSNPSSDELDERPDEGDIEKVETYQDVQTQSQWGGEVIVTTSTHIPGDSDDDAPTQPKKKKTKRSTDMEQDFAGNVEKYMKQLKGSLPGKKKKVYRQSKHKGRHGAANMKGMATGGDLKIAQRALQRSLGKTKGSHQARQGGPSKKRR